MCGHCGVSFIIRLWLGDCQQSRSVCQSDFISVWDFRKLGNSPWFWYESWLAAPDWLITWLECWPMIGWWRTDMIVAVIREAILDFLSSDWSVSFILSSDWSLQPSWTSSYLFPSVICSGTSDLSWILVWSDHVTWYLQCLQQLCSITVLQIHDPDHLISWHKTQIQCSMINATWTSSLAPPFSFIVWASISPFCKNH